MELTPNTIKHFLFRSFSKSVTRSKQETNPLGRTLCFYFRRSQFEISDPRKISLRGIYKYSIYKGATVTALFSLDMIYVTV